MMASMSVVFVLLVWVSVRGRDIVDATNLDWELSAMFFRENPLLRFATLGITIAMVELMMVLGEVACGVGACKRLVSACSGGDIPECIPGKPSKELCGDGVDNDCDGVVDEGFC